ncbi:MAG: GPW/gp25 family protein [Oscillospiraceae bacterium]|nr:GPW/gp25 family protein [Oscillospiraceae bacterium]
MGYTTKAADLKHIRFNTDLVSDVLQNIAFILATPKGSIPLYREFGLSTTFLDKPTLKARMAMRAEVKEAIERWEPRASFVNLTFESRMLQPGTEWPTVEVEIIGE